MAIWISLQHPNPAFSCAVLWHTIQATVNDLGWAHWFPHLGSNSTCFFFLIFQKALRVDLTCLECQMGNVCTFGTILFALASSENTRQAQKTNTNWTPGLLHSHTISSALSCQLVYKYQLATGIHCYNNIPFCVMCYTSSYLDDRKLSIYQEAMSKMTPYRYIVHYIENRMPFWMKTVFGCSETCWMNDS